MPSVEAESCDRLARGGAECRPTGGQRMARRHATMHASAPFVGIVASTDEREALDDHLSYKHGREHR